MNEDITVEEFEDAIDTLQHQPAFKTYVQGLKQDVHIQMCIVAQGGTDPYRQYYETGILEGLKRQVERLDERHTEPTG